MISGVAFGCTKGGGWVNTWSSERQGEVSANDRGK